MLNLTFNSKKAAKRFNKNTQDRTASASHEQLASRGFVRQTRTLWINFTTEETAECAGAAQ